MIRGFQTLSFKGVAPSTSSDALAREVDEGIKALDLLEVHDSCVGVPLGFVACTGRTPDKVDDLVAPGREMRLEPSR